MFLLVFVRSAMSSLSGILGVGGQMPVFHTKWNLYTLVRRVCCGFNRLHCDTITTTGKAHATKFS